MYVHELLNESIFTNGRGEKEKYFGENIGNYLFKMPVKNANANL